MSARISSRLSTTLFWTIMSIMTMASLAINGYSVAMSYKAIEQIQQEVKDRLIQRSDLDKEFDAKVDKVLTKLTEALNAHVAGSRGK